MGNAIDGSALRSRLTEIKSARSPAEVLGVTAGAAAEAVRAAYLSACKQYHPNRFAREEAAARKLALEVFIALKQAYEELSGERKAKANMWAAAGQPVTAAQAVLAKSTPAKGAPSSPAPRVQTVPPGPQAAKILTPPAPAKPVVQPAPVAPVRPGGTWTPLSRQQPAAPTTRPAIGTQPGQPVRNGVDTTQAMRLSRARDERAQHALAESQAGRHAEARKELYGVAAEEPQEKRWRVLLYLVWGHELTAEGKLDEALKQYERSLGLDPGHEPTKRALVELEARRKAKGGFWKSFLGK